MIILLACKSLWTHDNFNNSIIFHCREDTITVQIHPWAKFCADILKLVTSDPAVRIHALVPTASSKTIRLIDKLLTSGRVKCGDFQKICHIISLFGFKSSKAKRGVIKIYRSLIGSNFRTISKAEECLMCSIREGKISSKMTTADISSQRPPENECLCSRKVSDEVAKGILKFRDSDECPPQFKEERTSRSPLHTSSTDHRLNGLITSKEVEAGFDHGYIHGIASLNESDKLKIMHALKLNKQPFLSIHNISCIFDTAPTTAQNSSSKHVCILCSSVVSGRIALLGHIQNKHSGFWHRCSECWRYFTDERGAKRHYRAVHNKNIPFLTNCCSITKPKDSQESIDIGTSRTKDNTTND